MAQIRSLSTLKFASPKVAALFAICFTGFMTHGLLPDSMLAVTLVPVIKNKAGKIGSMDHRTGKCDFQSSGEYSSRSIG